ncbi:hypothetical protein EON65_19535 [archaeon]|nr:MAG: hypothetical protein EON65_19535 [archaeon]
MSQGVVAWTELLQLAMPFLSSEEQERVRKERIEFATSRSGEARIAMQGIPESPLKRLQSSFDDDEIEEVQEKVTLPKAVISRAKDEWSKEESKGKENSGYNSFDEDDTIEELPTVYESKPTKSDADKPSESKRHSQEEEKLSEFVRVNRQTWGKDSKDESKPRVMDSWESEKQDSWGKKDAWNKAKGRREVVRESVGSNSVLTDSMDEESIQDALSSQELPRGQGRDKSLSSYYDDGDDQKLDEKKGGANIGMAKNTGDWHSEDDEDIDEKETSKLGVKPFTGDRANIADKVERDISRENQTGKERLASASFETSMTEDKNRAATTSEVGQVDVTKREVDERMNKDGERERVHDEYGIKLVDDGGDDEANKPSWKRRETVGVAKKSQTFQLTSAELDSTLSTPTTSPVKRSVMELLYEYQGKPEAEESKGGNAEDNKQNTSNDVLGQTTSSKSPRKLPSDTGFKKQLSSKSSVRSLLSSSYNLLAHLGESKEKKEEDEESVMSSTDSRIDPNELNVLDRNTYLLKKAAKMSAKRQSAQSLVNRKVVTEKEEEKKTSGVLGLFGKKNDDAEANKGDRSRGLFSKVKHAFVFASRSSSPATRASLDSSSGGGPESIQAPKDLPDSAVFKPSETQSSRPPSPLIPNQPSGEPLEGVESKEAQSSSLVDGSKDSAGAGRDLLLSGNDVKNTGGASGGSFVQQSILIEPSLRKPIKKRDWDTAAPVSELTNAPAPTESGSVQTLLDYRPDESTAIATQDEDKEDAPRPTHRPLPPIPVSAPPTLEEISGNMHKDIPTAQKRLSNPALRRANSEQKVGELTYNAHSSSVPVSIPSCAPDPTSLRSASPTSLNVSIAPAAAASGAASHTGLVKLDGRGLAQLIRNTYSMQDAQLFAPPALRGSLSMSFSAYPRSSSPNAHHPHVPFSQAALPRSSSPMPRGSAVRFSVASVGTQGEEDIEELVRDGEGEFGCEEVDGDGSGRGKGANKGADRLRKLIQRSQMVSNVTQELIRIVQTGGKTDEGPAYVSLPVRFSVGTSAASTTQSVAVPRETILPTVWQQLLAIQQKTPWRPPVKSADSLLAYAEQIEEQSKQGELIASLLQYKDSLEPKSVYLTPKQIEEMQNLACLHGRIACDKRVGWRAAKEAKLLSKFGTSSQKSSMVTLQVPAYALKLFRPPSSLSFHDRKSFYSELHLAWGVRFAGKVKKNVPRAGFLRRYFVLVCNLRQNPNLIPPQSRFDLLTPEYHLLEYRDCLSSLWGEVAIGFKRGYCLTSQLSAIITEAKGGSKVGRDFTLVFNNWGGNYTVPIEDKRTGLAGIGADRVDVRSSSSTVKSAAGKSTPKSSLNRPQFLTMDLGGAGGGREGDEDSEDTGDRTWDGEGRNFAGRSRSAGAYSQTAESDRDSEAEENGEEDELEKEDEEVGHRFLERVTTLNAPSLPLSPPSASSTSPIPALRLPSEQQSILQPKDPKSHSPVFTVTLRAPSPSERLQWTQVLESVCPKGTFVNTVHY